MSKKIKKNPCPVCGKYRNRGLTVDAIIEIDGKILLIKRGNEPWRNMWALPGGYVDWNETVEQTLKRETREETSLEVVSQKLIGIYSKPTRHPRQTINLAYAVEVLGKPKAGDDALKLELFSTDKIPKKLASDHKEIIRDYLKKFQIPNYKSQTKSKLKFSKL